MYVASQNVHFFDLEWIKTLDYDLLPFYPSVTKSTKRKCPYSVRKVLIPTQFNVKRKYS